VPFPRGTTGAAAVYPPMVLSRGPSIFARDGGALQTQSTRGLFDRNRRSEIREPFRNLRIRVGQIIPPPAGSPLCNVRTFRSRNQELVTLLNSCRSPSSKICIIDRVCLTVRRAKFEGGAQFTCHASPIDLNEIVTYLLPPSIDRRPEVPKVIDALLMNRTPDKSTGELLNIAWFVDKAALQCQTD
jgi:hypothetical protein